MEIVLYSTNDGENVINKELIEKYRFNIKMKKDTDILNPIIILNDKNVMDFLQCNYCYIEEFKRFYFIVNVENINNHVWGLKMECDVLETYKQEILSTLCVFRKNVGIGDYYLNDTKHEVIKDIQVFKSDIILEGEKSLILSTIGGV